MAIEIRELRPTDQEAWRRLWDGYLRFYEASVPESITWQTWQRLLDPASGMFCRVAVARDCVREHVVGIAHCVLHPGTWVRTDICYLEDLFVDPEARGTGAGRALLEDLAARARERGWSRLYWHTRAGNATARRLYDHFTAADDFVKYEIELGAPER